MNDTTLYRYLEQIKLCWSV